MIPLWLRDALIFSHAGNGRLIGKENYLHSKRMQLFYVHGSH